MIIGPQGMNAEAQDYADIMSRATELNGQIKAKNLTLMQGANRIDFQNGSITPLTSEGAKPNISIDTRALGGMYANQVRLVSTEAGVGVNLSHIQANQNNLTMTVDGKITIAGDLQSQNEINVSAKNLHINTNTKLNAQKDITLATNTLTNHGQIISGKDMRVFADTVSNTGKDTLIQAQNNLWIQKAANGDLTTLIENKSGTVKTNDGDLVIRSKKLINSATTSGYTENIIQPNSTSKNLTITRTRADSGDYDVVLNAELITPLPDKWFGVADFKVHDFIDFYDDKDVLINTEQSTLSYNESIGIGKINSAKNIYINSNEVINDGALIFSGKNLIMTGDTLKNNSYNNWKKYKHIIYQADDSLGNTTSFSNLGPVKELILGIFYKRKGETTTLELLPNNQERKNIHSQGGLTLDFRNQINFEDILPIADTAITKIENKGTTSYPIIAKDIILNTNNIQISSNIKSSNDLSIIANQNINIDNANLNSARSQSLIANNNINLNQTNLTARDNTIIAKNGEIRYALNPISAFKDNQLVLPSINASNSLIFQAGKNITFDNTQVNKSNKFNLIANENIIINRNELDLINLDPANITTVTTELMPKIGLWESHHDMLFTAGKNIEAQGITFKSGRSLTFNAGQDIQLASKAINNVHHLFKTNRYPELRSKLIANGDITLNTARDIDLKSALLQSTGRITALSGRDMKLTTTPYSALTTPNEDWQDVQHLTTSITGNNGVTLASNGTITSQGSSIQSSNDILISSGGNTRLESVQTHYRKQEGRRLEDLYRHIGTTINSGKNLSIVSEGSILFQASRLMASGLLDIAANGGYLYAQAMEETSHYEERRKKCNRWTLCITRREVTNTHHDTTNKVTEFTASGNINLLAKDDVTLEASKISTQNNARITSQTGSVNFKAVKNSTFAQEISKSNGFYITQRNKGYTADKWVLPALHIGGQLTVEAAEGVTADIKAQNALSLQNALNALGKTEGTKWLTGLKDRTDVQWNLVQDAYDSWDYQSQHLNPVASALIMISVAAMTSGTATQFSAWAASGSTGTTGAMISGAAYSGMTALSTQAAVALAENKGNLSKTLKTLGQNDTVKSIIAQMAVSGALNGLDVKMGFTDGAASNSSLPLLSNGDWSKVAQRVAAQSTISSTINTAIQGGNFSDNFKNALLSNIGNQINAEGAKLIGDNGEILGHTGKVLSHSVVSGISAEVAGGNVKGAVVGSLAAQLAGITLDNNLINEKEWRQSTERQAQLSRVLGGFAGAIFTGDAGGAYSGANAAENTFRFNHLLHELAMDFDSEMQRCGDNLTCQNTIINKYATFSNQNTSNLESEIADRPLVAQGVTRQQIENAFALADRPYWASYLGADVMRNDLAKHYLQYWNAQDLALIDTQAPTWVKFASFIAEPDNQALLVSGGLLARDLSNFAVNYFSRNSATKTISASEIGMKWVGQGGSVNQQGIAWEDAIAATLPQRARLPKNFKTFDFFYHEEKLAISAKSMDTQTLSKLSQPKQIYSTLKRNIDSAATFTEHKVHRTAIDSGMIAKREIWLAIPKSTTQAQWNEINRAAAYGKNIGIEVKITQVKQ